MRHVQRLLVARFLIGGMQCLSITVHVLPVEAQDRGRWSLGHPREVKSPYGVDIFVKVVLQFRSQLNHLFNNPGLEAFPGQDWLPELAFKVLLTVIRPELLVNRVLRLFNPFLKPLDRRAIT